MAPLKSFKCRETERIFNQLASRKLPPDIQRVALRKLLMMEAARDIRELANPPGNKLEALKGDRTGQHSIRINAQFRICFVWDGEGFQDIEIVDYH
ncbi:MAG: type II toxin-antitoxin system RelE/ParE family toxin [Acidobacteriota bacterium]